MVAQQQQLVSMAVTRSFPQSLNELNKLSLQIGITLLRNACASRDMIFTSFHPYSAHVTHCQSTIHNYSLKFSCQLSASE